jgi:hypothetical protein
MNSDDRDDQYWQNVEKLADEIEQTAAGIRARRESQERRTRTVNDLMLTQRRKPRRFVR